LGLRGRKKHETGGICVMRIFMISIPHKNYSGDKINNNEKGKACGTYGEEYKCIKNFGGKTRGKEKVCKT
jgi:hypothetical protein